MPEESLLQALVPGGVLISRAVASQVPSALRGLTSVFGMGTGGALLLSSPESFSAALCFARMLLLLTARSLRAGFRLAPSKPHSGKLTCNCPQYSLLEYRFRLLAFAYRFRSSCRPISIGKLPDCSAFTADLSPDRLSGVFVLAYWNLLLEVGFTLRCLQRLSAPHFASQLCRWHDNCCTRDASTPVLSY